MHLAKKCANASFKTIRLFAWNSNNSEWIVVASHSLSQISQFHTHSQSGCLIKYCQPRQNQRNGVCFFKRLKNKPLLFSCQPLVPPLSSGFSAVAKKPESVTINENACPQGVQGDISGDCNFNLWLENCQRYGLENCDQQLQGIQTGRKTMAEVMAEQDKLIADIAAEYRRQNVERRRQASFQGVQQDIEVTRLPDINTPCPQGVQGEDCARFKLWLENCHRFQFGNCEEHLDSYKKGRITLAQLFEQQDIAIREAASTVSQNSTQTTSESVKNSEQQVSSKPLTSAQKLRSAVAVYGSTVMVFHISISLMSLGFFYTLVSSGIDVIGIMSRLGIGETILQSKLATGTGTFVVAYAVHKVFAPARIATTLAATPLIVRYLRRIGFLKTPPPKK